MMVSAAPIVPPLPAIALNELAAAENTGATVNVCVVPHVFAPFANGSVAPLVPVAAVAAVPSAEPSVPAANPRFAEIVTAPQVSEADRYARPPVPVPAKASSDARSFASASAVPDVVRPAAGV